MSDYNRQLFLSRLAKRNVLSKNKMEYYWPVVTQMTVDVDINSDIVVKTSSKSWKLKDDNIIENCNIVCGERVEIWVDKIDKDMVGDDIGFSIICYSTNEQQTTTDTIQIEGSYNIKNTSNKKICSFVIPLVTPWTYKIIDKKFNINTSNINIHYYPDDCRP